MVDGAFVARDVVLDTSGAHPTLVALAAAGTISDALDLGDSLVAPAALDLHLHGAGGVVVPPDGSPLELDRALTRAGAAWSHPDVPAAACEWIATLPVPSTPPVDPVDHVAAAAAVIAATPGSCVGIRIEGCFLSTSRAGVWPPETFRAPDLALLDELHAAARTGGSELRIVDVAPELDGAIELIEHGRELGIVMSLAHTDATWDEARRAIDAGATLATHTWNAMRPVRHRDPGVVTAALTDPRVTCELICDGIHLHPGTIALSIAASGAGRWVAVSDASPFAGSEPGTYDWAGTCVSNDGVALRDDAGRLAGSASLLHDALEVLLDAGVALDRAVAALGADPRRVIDPRRPRGLVTGDPVWVLGRAPRG